MQHGIPYRPEIDGLRAIAVLSVILFHAKLDWLPGGYVGVDVFFVISGFLITSIILQEDNQGGFSLLRFYERRIRRIFPALFVVIAASMVAGAVFFTPQDYTMLARSAIAAMAFYSNFYFARQAGYFAPASETQPLLHTWSLGVEEQFYLVAPFLIVLLNRHLKPYRTIILALLMALSLGFAVYGIHISARSAFFMPHTRAFELLIGVALAMQIVPRSNNQHLNQALGWTGLAMIAAAVLFYNSGTPFPGFAALLPTLGTALVIHATAGEKTGVAALLATRPMVAFGKISYSLYLWHWPLLAFAEYEYGEMLQPWHRLLLLSFAVALSCLTYLWVEQPARRTKLVSAKAVIASGLASMALVFGAATMIDRNSGFEGRLSPAARETVRKAHIDNNLWRICPPNPKTIKSLEELDCKLGDKNARPTYLVIGDSHAASLAQTINDLGQAAGANGRLLTAPGCPPFFGLEAFASQFAKCLPPLKRVEQLLNDPDLRHIVLFGRWALYAEAKRSPNEIFRTQPGFSPSDLAANQSIFLNLYVSTVKRMSDKGKTVTIIGPTPEMHVHVPTAAVKAAMQGRQQDIVLERHVFDERQKTVFRAFDQTRSLPNVRFSYPHEKMCSQTLCYGSRGGTLFYADDNHVGLAAIKLFEAELKQALGL